MRVIIFIAASFLVCAAFSHNHDADDDGKLAIGLSEEDIISTVVKEVRRKREAEADAVADPGLKKLIKKLGKSSKKSKRSLDPDVENHKVESQKIRRDAEADAAPGNIKKIIKKFKREAVAEAEAEPGLKKFIKKLNKGSKKNKRNVELTEFQSGDAASFNIKTEAEAEADPGLKKITNKLEKSKRNTELGSVKLQEDVEIGTQKIKREAEAEAEPGLKKLLKKLKKSSKKSKREVTEDLRRDVKIEDDVESDESQQIELGLKKTVGSSLSKSKRDAGAEAEPGLKKFLKKLSKFSKNKND